MIRLDRVTRRFDGKTVISDLSFTFPDRGVFALMGPSGSGKTTLLRLLAGLDVPDGGSIESTHQKTAVAFQEHRLLPWLNCEDNLKLVLSKNKNSSVSAQEWLEAMELTDATKLFPKELSGGMKSRVALARALVCGGDLFLLDEPFSALDEALQRELCEKLRTHLKEIGASAILVTHQSSEAASLADRTVLLSPITPPPANG